MNTKKITAALLSVAVLLSAAACGGNQTENPESEDSLNRETFAKETYAAAGDFPMTLSDGLPLDFYAADTPVGAWLAGCNDSDRDDFFDAYVLRHESAAEGNTTFTYLVYYPHGGTSLAVTPELLEGENGYLLNLRYTVTDGDGDYSLCHLSVTLPTENAPRLRLLLGDEALGLLSTVSETPIP